MKPDRKRLLYFAFILLTLLFIAFIGMRSGDFMSSLDAVFSIPRRYVLLCVLCTFGGIFVQAISAKSALRTMGYSMPMRRMYAISILGEFYSFITPGASGGQPMQIHQMHRRGVSVGDATCALIVHYICYHAMLLAMDIVLGVAHWSFARKQLGVNWPFLLVGFIFNAMLIAIAVMLSFYQRPVRWLLEKIISIMNKLKIGKPNQLRERFAQSADTFYNGMRFLMKHKLELVWQMLCGIMRIVCMMSVIYFVYLGLGQRGASFGKILTMGVMQYTSAAYTPLPGASGAQEGIFSVYFDQLLPEELMFSGLLAWRFITYYLVLIVGFAVTTVLGVRGKNAETSVERA